MSFKTKMIIKFAIIYTAAAVLIVLGLISGSGLLDLGRTLAIVNTLLVVRFIFTAVNKNRLEALENDSRDERTAFVAMKSYSFAFWVALIAEFLATCVLYWFDMRPEVMILNYVICFQAVAYVTSYLIFNKKY